MKHTIEFIFETDELRKTRPELVITEVLGKTVIEITN